jgi:hypothetical protein
MLYPVSFSFRPALCVAALSLSVVACDPLGGTTHPGSPNAVDSAAVTPLLQGALDLARTTTQFIRITGIKMPGPDSLFWWNAARCAPSSVDLGYRCPVVSSLGPFSTTEYYLYRGADKTLGFDPALTSSIQIVWNAQEIYGNPNSLVHQWAFNFLDMTIDSLRSGLRTIHGSADGDYSARHQITECRRTSS